MFRKVIIGLGIVVVLFVAWVLVYFFYITRLASPAADVHFENKAFSVDVNYCRPSKKERLIFGYEQDGALVPFGKYWRLGANQSTEITFSSDVKFGDTSVKPGRYRMYVIPDKASWLVRLNSEIGEWGAMEPDYSMDILEFVADVEEAEELEMFTISFSGGDEDVVMKFHWDQTQVNIPISAN